MAEQETRKKNLRGRPSRAAEEVAGTRRRIADHAFRLFKEDGYNAVSMRKLAQSVGCTPRTIYAYFGSKFEILTMIWSEIFDDLFAQLNRISRADTDAAERLKAVSNRYVSYWLDNTESYFLVFMSGGIKRTDVENFVTAETPEQHFALFRECIAGVMDEDVSRDQIDRATEVLVCGLNGIVQAHATLHGHAWSAPEELVGVMVDSAVGV